MIIFSVRNENSNFEHICVDTNHDRKFGIGKRKYE